MADQLWSRLFQLIPGTTSRTAAILASHNPEKGKEALRKVLRTRNPKGLATHARCVLAFHAWHHLRWPNLDWLPPDGSEDTTAVYAAILVDYLEDLMDADVGPGVPRNRLASLSLALKICNPSHGWPTKETIVVNLTVAYFREGRHKKRDVRLYRASEIILVEQALAHPPNKTGTGPVIGPLERLVLATELRKLYGRLRQDDATWGFASTWNLIVKPGNRVEPTTHWRGVATKAKGTEMRANWIKEEMPWIVPTRGLSPQPASWHARVTDDMHEVGMRGEDEYLLPSPPAVRAGRRPPGAADHLEWINLLRRTLVKIGFAPEQAATVSGHTAKRTMLTWLNASGYIKSDQEQQAAGYHRAKGPGSVSRKYTFHEQSGPVRAIEEMCQAIRDGRFHPDRPEGSEWDVGADPVVQNWDLPRTPGAPQTSPATGQDIVWDSDDEAPPDRNPMLEDDTGAADLLDAPTVKRKREQQELFKGFIYTLERNPNAKRKKKRYHIAVNYSKVPEQIVGCKRQEGRASIVHEDQALHVLCDTQLTSPMYAAHSRELQQQGQIVCSVCRSRRNRWRSYVALQLSQP